MPASTWTLAAAGPTAMHYTLALNFFVLSVLHNLKPGKFVHGQESPYIIGVFPEEDEITIRSLNHQSVSDVFQIERLNFSRDGLDYEKLQAVYEQLSGKQFLSIVGSYHDIVGIVAERMRVPYLCTHAWTGEDRGYVYRMLPQVDEFSEALIDLMTIYQWSEVGLMYEENLDFRVLQGYMETANLHFSFWKFPQYATPTDIKKRLMGIRDTGIHNFLLLTSPSVVKEIFRQGRRLGLISPSYSWMVLNLVSDDISEGILDDIEVNVTSVGLVVRHPGDQYPGLISEVGHAALYDTISLLRKITRRAEDEGVTLSSGKQTKRYMEQLRLDGITGNVEFEGQKRVNYVLNIMAHKMNSFSKVAEWSLDAPHKMTWQTSGQNNQSPSGISMRGRHFKIVTILEKPFTYYRKDHETLTGNDKFEGFAVDLIKYIAEMYQFTYELYIVPDGKFGSKNKDGTWNGMIGEVLSGAASMTVAPLSINAERENAIDFTKPFKTRGITVLMKTPKSQPSFFQFLRPLSWIVWLCIGLAVVTISVVLYLLEHYSIHKPSNSRRNDVIVSSPDIVKEKLNTEGESHEFSVPESCWFVFGSLVQGSTEVGPGTVPGRILTGAWWLFALMMVSTYTANLAAFLTVKKIQPPISSVTDLAEQTKITFGTVKNSGVESFFIKTNIPTFKQMFSMMSELFPDAMVENTTEGFKRIRDENYAFLWDSTVTSYMAAVDCDFTEIGPPFDPKGFGVGTPPGASYRENISLAILRLSDRGVISELENKYWSSGKCQDYGKPSTDATTELQLENVGGIFIILLVGGAGALLAGAISRILTCLSGAGNNKRRQTANDVVSAPGNDFTFAGLRETEVRLQKI